MKIKDDNLDCWRCGQCCRDLLKGVKVTEKEWEALEEDLRKLRLDPIIIKEAKHSSRLPTIDEYNSKRCVFLKGKDICRVYPKRPKECQRFPIWFIEGSRIITFVVSYICPRAESLAEHLRGNLPNWATDLLKERSYRVVLI